MQLLIWLKSKDYEMRKNPFTRHDVYVADEVFLTGTAVEVIAGH